MNRYHIYSLDTGDETYVPTQWVYCTQSSSGDDVWIDSDTPSTVYPTRQEAVDAALDVAGETPVTYESALDQETEDAIAGVTNG